jgi:hypothetical protein
MAVFGFAFSRRNAFPAMLRRENPKRPSNKLRFFRFYKTPLRSAATFLTKTRESEDASRITIL